MRKRRVLAALLALSLVVSGNGMTVLAAGPGIEQSGLTAQTETPEVGEKTGEDKQPGTTQEPVGGEQPGTTQEPVGGEQPGTPQEPGEGKQPEQPGTPQEPGEGKQPEQPGTPQEPGEGKQPEQPGTPQEPGEGKQPEQPGTPQEPGEGKQPEQPVIPQEPVEEEKPEETQPPVQPEEELGDEAYISRIVTFTDDTGMQVTYDANASTQYKYVVESGVLTAVKKLGTTVSGNTIEEPITFEGNVELKQPEEGEKYTSIAGSVFGGNKKITYVKLPAGLETIGEGAFKDCTALKGVYLPAGVNKIENSAFENCTAMTQINVPKAVTAIGDKAFKGDARLYLVYMKDMDYSELKTIGAEAFSGCAVLSQFCSHSDFVFPTKLESIGEAAFQGCKTIKKVDFTANKKLTSIGKSVFAGCTGITDLSPGKNLSEIPEEAFFGCTSLVNINFENGKAMTIGKKAFAGCYGLKQLVLPYCINKICEYAFQGCTKLKQVEIKCWDIEIEPKAFPSDAADLVIVAEKGSNGYIYAQQNEFGVPDENALYQYTVEDVDGVTINGGVFPGGTIWVGKASSTSTKPGDAGDVNKQNKDKGVKKGELCRIYIFQSPEQEKNYTFIPESLRCNGKTMQKKEGTYYFEMPAGGAIITAEFRANTPDKIKGQTVTVEFSNGTPLQNGKTDQYGYLGIELRVGQTSRMFLLDEDGSPIPAAKLSMVKSDNEKVAKIDKNGVITATGTEGRDKADATVTVELKGGDGNTIRINRQVSVTTAEAKNIILKASDYSSLVTIEGDPDGIQTASIKKNIVRAESLSFKLKANVFDGEEGISKDLTWTTSNAKVAVLKKDSTLAENPTNEVIVQKGCEGEATITVTAKNPTDSEKEKITQKFVVRVYEEGYKLTSSTVTVNPRMAEGGTIELISAYGMGLEGATVELYEEKSLGTTKFTVSYDAQESSDVCKRFHIRPISETIKNGTYKVRVGVNGDKSEKNLLPLTITVKADMPKPTVKFNVKKAKFNLFYKDGGKDAEGNSIAVVTEVTKLNGNTIKKAALEPLTQKEDDRLFTENFVIDETGTDLSKGRVVVKRSAGNLKYTSKKKAAVTGYLVLYFDGFDNSAAKKVKVTMPTCTTAPSWALRTTKATYRANADVQDISLVLYDKKTKKKEQVLLDAENYTVTAEEKGDVALMEKPKITDGAIAVRFLPDKGSMKLVLHNPAWDNDKNGKERTLSYTYTVSVSNAKPTVKPDQSSVSLNLNYPEKSVQFKLVSNLGGIEIEKQQTFTPVVTKSNGSEIAKLRVTYEDGVGTASIMGGQSVKKGTYKFECNPKTDEQGVKKTVLTVKVVDGKPTVKLGKGTLQLNTVVYNNNSKTNSTMADSRADASVNGAGQAVIYQETSERTFTVNTKPEGYTLAPVGSGADKTEIVCTTKKKAGAEKNFLFTVEEHEKDDVLKVSLKNPSIAKGTYSFKMTPRLLKEGATTVSAKSVNFSVKVISTDDIYMTASSKGKINLLNREGEISDKNGILYTPALKNVVGKIEAVKIYDAGSLEEESKYFDISLIEEGKNAGKFFVTPKKIAKQENPDGPITYTYAELESNKNYPVRIWAQVKGYAGDVRTKGGVFTKTIRIKTSQVLPKVTTDKTSMDVYLSTKSYNANFVVKPKEGSVGAIEQVYFGEKDEMAQESFELVQTPQADGSMKVTVHLKEAVSFANGTVNNVKFYVKYKGQGTNTSETATGFTMKIRVN